MNKRLWFFVSIVFLSVETAFAACAQQSTVNFSPPSLNITNLNHTQTYNTSMDLPETYILFPCEPRIRVNGKFIARSGNTDLTGRWPYGINASTIMITGSSADAQTLNAAKAWLARNFKITFRMGQSMYKYSNPLAIGTLNVEYPIIPIRGYDTILNNSIVGMEFSTGAALGGISLEGWMGLTTRIHEATISLTDSTKPSAEIIAALDGATLRIHLGTYNYIYGPINDLNLTSETKGSAEIYLNLTFAFTLPTCTIADQTVNLATVPSSVLTSQIVANEQRFKININCTGPISNKVLSAKITDSYTPSNINRDGILKNQPNLANKSNVDVQLMDEAGTPLSIGGTRNPFYTVPGGSIETNFSKTLKARYYRSEPTATPGYVQTQAIVLLEYE